FENVINEKLIYSFDYKNLINIEKISEGAFGVVQKAECTKYNMIIVLKSLKLNTYQNKISKDFINELSLLRKIGFHPNISCFYGITK
ncbi:9079_t:CDS:2, partial [Cetraspora pellucida]